MDGEEAAPRELARRYVRWQTPEEALARRSHFLCQLMQMGTAEDGVLRMASLPDLGRTKLKVLLRRVEAKDCLDVHALLEHGLALSELLGAAQTLFGPAFKSLTAQKALAYFEGGDLARLPLTVRPRPVAEATRDPVVSPRPRLSARLD